MIVGTSKVRASEARDPIPIAIESGESHIGVWMINLNTMEIVANITFDGDIEQIYDIAVIPDSNMPELLNINSSLTRHLFDFEKRL